MKGILFVYFTITYLLILILSITETIRLMMSLQVDRIKQKKIGWNSDYVNPNSQAYRILEDESVYAVSKQ